MPNSKRLVIIRYKSGSVTSYASTAKSIRLINAEEIASIDFEPLNY